ncbi:MAG: type IV toxin-antitoxin system AbiEi family antitoxin [Pseudomonadota bacterium]
MIEISEYIKKVRASGRWCFTTGQAIADLKISQPALRSGIYRLKKKGDIVSPAKNLYVIVPPEYQYLGCLPAAELIPILMKHWGLNYYACLLTAGMYHGASHQKPQIFQIMVAKQIKPLICGKVRVEFIRKKDMNGLPLQDFVVKTGILKVSSPELTAIDLLLYRLQSGGLNNIATVLSELLEVMIPHKLIETANLVEEKACLQRLGYILEHIDPMEDEKRDDIVAKLHEYTATLKLTPVSLMAGLPTKNCSLNKKWMIIENTTIEND